MRIDTTSRSKFPRQSLQVIMPLVATAWLAAPSICHANVILTYTGKHFTSFTSPYTGTDKVTASITLATPLGDNLPLTLVTPLAFSLSDGVQTISNTSQSFATKAFEFSTDVTGNITFWLADVVLNNNNAIHTEFQFTGDPGESDLGIFGNNQAENRVDPGSWTITTPAVPEPPTVSVLGAGLMGLGLLWWRRRQKLDLAQG